MCACMLAHNLFSKRLVVLVVDFDAAKAFVFGSRFPFLTVFAPNLDLGTFLMGGKSAYLARTHFENL